MKNIFIHKSLPKNNIKKGCSKHPKALKTSYIFISCLAVILKFFGFLYAFIQ